MKLFYSPSSNSFQNDLTHGTRTVFVEDDKVKEVLLQSMGKVEADLHEQLDAAESDDDKAARNVELALLAEDRRLLLLNPPMIEVENPECRLPADAVEISVERHAELMAAQGDGKTFRPGTDGLPEITERVRPVEEVLASARASRDRQLAATDWTQLPDALTAAKRKAWAEHRKHLRELPARIEELMDKGTDAAEAANLVQRNVSATLPKGDA